MRLFKQKPAIKINKKPKYSTEWDSFYDYIMLKDKKFLVNPIELSRYVIYKTYELEKPVSYHRLKKMLFLINERFFDLTGILLLDRSIFEVNNNHININIDYVIRLMRFGGTDLYPDWCKIYDNPSLDLEEEQIELINDIIEYYTKICKAWDFNKDTYKFMERLK